MEHDKLNDQDHLADLPPLDLGLELEPVDIPETVADEMDDLDDLLGPELMAILGREPSKPRKTEPDLPDMDPPAPLQADAEEDDLDLLLTSQPAPKQEQPRQEQRPAAPMRRRPQRRQARKGTKIFYTIYAAFVILAVTTLLAVTIPLHNWLVEYEKAQPEEQSAQNFQVLFADPDWAVIYDLAEVQDTVFESKDEYIAYMEAKMEAAGDPDLTYYETSAGLSGNRKYYVTLKEERIAAFTMVPNKNSEGTITGWKLGQVEVFFQRNESINVQKLPGWCVFVNGKPLDDSYTVRTVGTVAESYLPNGLHGYRLEEQAVSGLLVAPEVIVVDSNNQDVPLTYNPETNTYEIPVNSTPSMTDDDRTVALDAAKAHALFYIRAITTGELRDHFDPNSQTYKDLVETDVFMQSYRGYTFDDNVTEVTDFYRYSDNFFTARVKLKLDVTRKNGTVKSWEQETTYFFSKTGSGKYLVTQTTNESVLKPTEQVRLSLVVGDQQVSSFFVEADSKNILMPTIEIPEGQVFKGWAEKSTDDKGSVTMNILFVPDEHQQAVVPEDLALIPMTLYAVFEAEEGQ